ncbi:MAG: AraC family transcriptional regulator [Lentisphaerae bacterium]|nr:MAG: AraC family transcriptional regulator [Lentisphaerota bacterium]
MMRRGGELPNPGITVRAMRRIVKETYTLPTHHHTYFELLYLTEGRMEVCIRNKTMRAGAGDLLVYFPFEDHTEKVFNGVYAFTWIRFESDLAQSSTSFPAPQQIEPVIHLPWPDRFQQLFDQMILDQQIEDPWSRLILHGHLMVFFGLLQRATRFMQDHQQIGIISTDNSQRIQQILAHIHENLQNDLSIRELASRAVMSESHFSHLFKEFIGVPPRQYFIYARMRKAQNLLLNSKMPIHEIAARVGYEDARYFARTFRRIVGLAPSKFREQGTL